MSNKKDYKFKVVITDAEYKDFDLERKELEKVNADLSVCQCKSEDELVEATKDADGLLVQYANINRNVIKSLKKCKVIARYGIGVDTIDIQAATEHNICIVNVKGYCLDEVSDHAITLALTCIRKVVLLNNAVKKGIWDYKIATPIFRLKNKKFGLVGFGSIGRMVVRKAQAFGFSVLAYDPYISLSVMRENNVEKMELEDLLKESDVISLHLPLNKYTKYIISKKELKLMKKTAFLINTSRGSLINEEDLYNALNEKWIAGAGLDVLEEIPINSDYKLLKLGNLVITPHAAFYSEDSLRDLQRIAAVGVAQVLKGEIPSFLVNKEVLKGNCLKSQG
ncbi:MAG: C-terminal binding protein [Candidatus Marinimicrobia bacterium]|nr:C-terminal binding protein [Candidatus Neomarinimicrobiota bacterium]